jgi:hypothetical protein
LLLVQVVPVPLHMLLLVRTVLIRAFGHHHHFLLFGRQVVVRVEQEDRLEVVLDPLTLMVVLVVPVAAVAVMQVVPEV